LENVAFIQNSVISVIHLDTVFFEEILYIIDDVKGRKEEYSL